MGCKELRVGSKFGSEVVEGVGKYSQHAMNQILVVILLLGGKLCFEYLVTCLDDVEEELTDVELAH
jgi:hypothetical protein